MGNVTVAYDYPGRAPSMGSKRMMTGTITMSSSYATGGDSIAAGDRRFGMPQMLESVQLFPGFSSSASKMIIATPDSTSAPTKIFAAGDLNATTGLPYVQIASTTDLSTYVIRFFAIGL